MEHEQRCHSSGSRSRFEKCHSPLSILHSPFSIAASRRAWRWLAVGWFTLLPCWVGCAAFHPLKGVPVQYFPQELRGETRADKETIDLSLLRQTPPEHHLVDAGDVLAVHIEGILGRPGDIPPVFFPQNNEVPPSLGYPIPVRDDGTLSLPLIKPLHVRAMTLTQVEDAIRQAYTVNKQFLQAEPARILVSLQRPRTYTVLVIRQEGSTAEAAMAGGGLTLGSVKRGTGKLVKLPVGENDVLHALAETGGLPGLDAENQIVIVRRRRNAAGANVPPAGEFGGRAGAGAGTGADVIQQTAGTRGGDGWGHTPAQVSSPFSASFGASPRWPQGPELGGRVVAQADNTLPPSALRNVAPPAPPAPAVPAPWDSQPTGLISPKSSQPTGTWPPSSAPATAPAPVISPSPSPSPSPTPSPALRSPAPQMPGVQAPPSMPMGPTPTWQPSARSYQGPLPNSIQGLDWGSQDASRFVDWNGRNRDVVKIPIRMTPGQQPQVTEEDIILHDGDIVFIESRDTEVFYTGGLLGGGQYQLPRDYDLDVLSAISIATARQATGAGGGGFANRVGGISAINQDISVSASDVVILRQLPDGNQIPIKLDLGKALRDPKYRIRIQPGDYLILQYKPHEAVAAFVERNLLAGGILSLAAVTNQGR